MFPLKDVLLVRCDALGDLPDPHVDGVVGAAVDEAGDRLSGDLEIVKFRFVIRYFKLENLRISNLKTWGVQT